MESRRTSALTALAFVNRTKPPLVLEIDLTRGLLSAPPTDPLGAVRARNTPTLTDIAAGLRLASSDPAVAGALITVADTISVAQAEELGAVLESFAAAGKPTVAVATSFGELSPGTIPYYLALHTDTIWLQPSGAVGLTGVALEVTTLRGVLDKLDAEPQLGQRHEYKSAAETLMSTEVSPPNREMTQRITDSVVDQIAALARRRRGFDAEDFAAVLAASPVPAAEALRRGLVDHLGYRDEAYAEARRQWGVDGEVRLQYAHRYARHRLSRPVERALRHRRPKIGVISVRGSITTGRSRNAPIGGPASGSDTVCAALRQGSEDESLAAIILRIDSPGGSYVASDAIRRAIQQFRATGRPIVAAMSDVAASGGYFVAMPCDAIVAEPSTLTGSIGVLGGKVVLGRTYERFGVTREAIGAGPEAAMFSDTTGFDANQWAKVDTWLDSVYADFTAKAAADRGMELTALEPLARGRVWTGADARTRGLVDRLGGRREAVEIACERARLDPEKVTVIGFPQVSALHRLVPAESSDSTPDAASAGPDGLLSGLARAAGLEMPGALTLPWRMRLR